MGFIKKRPMTIMGVIITILFLVMCIIRVEFLDSTDLKFYDLMMNMRGDPEGTSQIVIVDIDDDSIEKLGRWPWPRSLLAEGIKKIDAAGPKVIGLNIILSEPERVAGLKELGELENLFKTGVMNTEDDRDVQFLKTMESTRLKLNNDKKLAEAIKASGKVILPVFFKRSQIEENAEPEDAVMDHTIPEVFNDGGMYNPVANDMFVPIPALFKVCSGIGHVNFNNDMDGKGRRESLFYEYRGVYIPSYTLRLAAYYLKVPLDDITIDVGFGVAMGSANIPITLDDSSFLINFKGPTGSFKKYSFFDVINDKVSMNVFKNKIVLVGPSAAGIINPLSTPTDSSMPLMEFSANTIWSMLNKRFIVQPSWAAAFELLMVLLVGLLVILLLPRLRARTAGLLFLLLVIVLIGLPITLFSSKGYLVKVMYPLTQLFLGYIGVVSIQFLLTETKKDKVEGESAETNRMLGISFQAQGMLDMAFDKFRRIPIDDEVKDLLYNLALDYERKRQLNKAASVYEYIEKNDSKFKDVGAKKTKLMQASETMIYGDGGLGGGGGDGFTLDGSTKPTLGRYEIEKKLGQGAMGIVYLGRDPRINRTTAIKTFKFGDDLEPDDIEKMKEKFFREAESAGTLSHPNIVTIYDAGDEQDMAYIAMEFLEGTDLDDYVKKDTLMAVKQVVDYMADIASGLGYAHEKGIVHRDIKPANIMLLRKKEEVDGKEVIKEGPVKITDFGIARITATSQTQTGVVKGTPYYMSPEQFSGEKVDGRSDIFSMGTMMYQLLTSEYPFTGDSPASLMNCIMNKAHADPREYNKKIPKPLVDILNRTLAKTKEKRYQKAEQLEQHLKKVSAWMTKMEAQKKADKG